MTCKATGLPCLDPEVCDRWACVRIEPGATRPHALCNPPHHGGLGPTFWTWDAEAAIRAAGFGGEAMTAAIRALMEADDAAG